MNPKYALLLIITLSAGQWVFGQARVMHPTKANADGSYIYLFIMFPYINGENYGIESLVKKMYGAKQGAEQHKPFAGAMLTGKDVGYRVIQLKN